MDAIRQLADDPDRLAVLVLVALSIVALLWLCAVSFRRARMEQQDGEFMRSLCGDGHKGLRRSPGKVFTADEARASDDEAIDAHVRSDPSLDRRTRALYAATLKAVAERRTNPSDEPSSDD